MTSRYKRSTYSMDVYGFKTRCVQAGRARAGLILEKLKRRIPDAKDDALLGDLLAQAGAFVRSYTRRDVVPDELMDAQIEIAAMLYHNRMRHGGGS